SVVQVSDSMAMLCRRPCGRAPILRVPTMTTLVITTRDDQELGFVLFARHDGMWPPAGTNDCIITPFPASDSSLLDDPAARFVAEHAGKEWVAEIGYGEDEMTVSIAFS